MNCGDVEAAVFQPMLRRQYRCSLSKHFTVIFDHRLIRTIHRTLRMKQWTTQGVEILPSKIRELPLKTAGYVQVATLKPFTKHSTCSPC